MNELEMIISNVKTDRDLRRMVRCSSHGPFAPKEHKILAQTPKEEIIKSIIKLERYDLLGAFSNGFDIITNINDKIKIIKHIKTVPFEWKTDRSLIDFFLKEHDYYIAFQFDLDQSLKYKLKAEAINVVKSITNNLPANLKGDTYLLEICIEEKRGDLINQFDSSIFSASIVNKYLKELVLIETLSIEKIGILQSHPEFFRLCLDKKRYDLLGYFSKDLLTDDIIEQYGVEIVKHYKNNIPGGFRNNKKIFDKVLEAKRYDLIREFDQPLITEDILSLYAKQILDTLCVKKDQFDPTERKYLNAPNVFCNSQALLKLALSENRTDIIPEFSGEAIDKEIIELYGQQLLDMLSETEEFYRWTDSCHLLEYCLQNKKYNIISRFALNAYDEHIIKNYNIIELLDRGIINIPFIQENRYLYAAYLEIDKNFDSLVRVINYDPTSNLAKKKLENVIFLDKYLSKCDLLMLNYINFDNIFDNISELDLNLLEKHFMKISQWIKEYNGNTIPYNLTLNHKFKQFCYDNKIYELFIQIPFITKEENVTNIDQIVKQYAPILDITEEEMGRKLNILYEKNDEILMTLFPSMLSKRMDGLNLKHILTIGLYQDLQYIVINLNEHELSIFNRLLDLIDNSEYDTAPIIYSVLQNLEHYENLIYSIDPQKITIEQLNNLLLVLQEKDNIYNIENLDDLTNKNFENKVIEKYKQFNERLNNNEIDIEELKEMLYRKKYGLSKEKFDFIYNRYCSNETIITNSKLPTDVKVLLLDIYELYHCTDFEKLKNNYLISDRAIVDFKTTLFLESSIRNEYTKLYNDTLYKLKNENLLENSQHLITNPKTLNKLNNVKFNNKKIKTYILDGDFNLLIHALGAYSRYERPNNFLDNWLMPKMTYHGICTSYIGNNQIANARAYHPILGFDSIESNGLLLSANYDIGSNRFNTLYDTSNGIACNFLPPKEQIDYTRHTHNEMVIERMLYENNKCYKKMPAYIVYLVDDINNQYNYMTKEELIEEFREQNKDDSIIEQIKTEPSVNFIERLLNNNQISIEDAHKIHCVFYYEETIQAAADMNLPLVLVDRLKYAKKESEKSEELYHNFINTKDSKYMDLLLSTYFNNAIGCIRYTNYNLEYYNYFNNDGFNKLYENILEYINSQEDINIKIMLLIDLINSLETEASRRRHKQNGNKDRRLFPLSDKINDLKILLENLKSELIRGENNGRKNK